MYIDAEFDPMSSSNILKKYASINKSGNFDRHYLLKSSNYLKNIYLENIYIF